MGGRGSSKGGDRQVSQLNGITSQQRDRINQLKERFQVGNEGVHSFGGEGSTIIEAPTFQKNNDGTISYKVVGERFLPGWKSGIIGDSGEKDRIRTTVTEGKILSDGKFIKTKTTSDTRTVSNEENKRKRRN